MAPAVGTAGLVNTGLNALRKKRPGAFGGVLGQRPAPPRAPAPGTPADANPTDTNAAPPGSALPVGNGITPTIPAVNPMVPGVPRFTAPGAPSMNIMAPPTGSPADAKPWQVDPALAPPAAPAPPPEYSPTGLNFGPGHDLQSSVIAPDATAPDRAGMAKSLLADFDKSTADANREDYRLVGSNAAKFGRLGMGSTAQDVQEVGRKHLTDRATLEAKLAYDTSDQGIQDAINSRNEMRTERGYQTGRSESAIDRRVQEAELEEMIRNGTFRRGMGLAELGRTGNPAGAQLAGAQAGAAQSGDDITGILELLKRYGYSSATKGAAA